MEKPVWTILKILNWTKQYFESKGVENPRLDSEILLCAVLHCERIKLFTNFEQPLTEAELKKYKEYVQRRAGHEPLAYIVGEKAFLKNSFKVTPATLIPRPETELLVESVQSGALRMSANGNVKILDIGTGSGAIIISLLESLPSAKGVAVDISRDALNVAAENAEKIGVRQRCAFIQSDLFSGLPEEKKFDIIVSNPPYIPSSDIDRLAQDVRREPRGALDGGIDGLVFYRRIIAEAADHMEDGGLLAFEIGIGQSAAVLELCTQAGFAAAAVRKDYAGIDRMVFALKKGSRSGTDDENLLLEITRGW